jgi:hypothetical protein
MEPTKTGYLTKQGVRHKVRKRAHLVALRTEFLLT